MLTSDLAIYSGCMADVHKSNFDDAELPELEPVDDDSTGDLQSNVESDLGTGRGPSLDELSGICLCCLRI